MQLRTIFACLALAAGTLAVPLAEVHSRSDSVGHAHGRTAGAGATVPEVLVQDRAPRAAANVPPIPAAAPKTHTYTRRARAHP